MTSELTFLVKLQPGLVIKTVTAIRPQDLPKPGGLQCAILMLLVLTGCAHEDDRADASFGSTVRHMIAVQTANPGRSAYGLDGQKAALILDNYRKDVAIPQEVDSKGLGTSEAANAVNQQ